MTGRRSSAFTTSRPTRCLARWARTVSSQRIRPTIPTRPIRSSKAGADHLVRAWGPHLRPAGGADQLREQLRAVPVSRKAHSDGDHPGARREVDSGLRRRPAGARLGCMSTTTPKALLLVLQKGRLGETYCIGGDSTKRNLEVIQMLCAALDKFAPANTAHADKIALSPTVPATTSAIPSTPRSWNASSAGRRRGRWKWAWRRRCAGTWTTATGSRAPPARLPGPSGWAS